MSILASCTRSLAVAGELQGQLATEQEGRRAASRDLVAAQREMEGLVQQKHELEQDNAAMGDRAHQVQVEQEELRARFEAQLAELTSVKVGTLLFEHDLQVDCVACFR